MRAPKRWPKAPAPTNTRPISEIFREVFTRRLEESAAVWAGRMATASKGSVPSGARADEPPDPPYEPAEPINHTWTKDDEHARTQIRIALAKRPFGTGMPALMTNRQEVSR